MKYRIKNDVKWKLLEQNQEIVLINLKFLDDYFCFNTTATEIFLLIIDGYDEEQISKILCEKYGINLDIMKKEVCEFCNDLVENDILEKRKY